MYNESTKRRRLKYIFLTNVQLGVGKQNHIKIFNALPNDLENMGTNKKIVSK